MKNKETYPLIDAVSAVFASVEYQAKLAKDADPEFPIEKSKPSAPVYINIEVEPREFGIDTDTVTLPAISAYAKKTLGMDDRWLDQAAIAVEVTDKHREDAEKAIATISNKVMMMVLKGTAVNGFIGSLGRLLENETIASRDIGLLSYVPKTARQFAETAKIDEKKTQFMNSRPLGQIGDKVFATVTVFNSRVMSQYESVLYETHDDAGNLVTFFKNEAAKDQFEVGGTYKINGKVKVAAPTPYSYGALVNTLNYVRLQK